MLKSFKTMFTSPARSAGTGDTAADATATGRSSGADPLSPGSGADFDSWYEKQFANVPQKEQPQQEQPQQEQLQQEQPPKERQLVLQEPSGVHHDGGGARLPSPSEGVRVDVMSGDCSAGDAKAERTRRTDHTRPDHTRPSSSELNSRIAAALAFDDCSHKDTYDRHVKEPSQFDKECAKGNDEESDDCEREDEAKVQEFDLQARTTEDRLKRRHTAMTHLINGSGIILQREKPTKVLEPSMENARAKEGGAPETAPDTSKSEIMLAVRDVISRAEVEEDSSDEEAQCIGTVAARDARLLLGDSASARGSKDEVDTFEKDEKLHKIIATLIKERDEARATCVRLCQEAARTEFRRPIKTVKSLQLLGGARVLTGDGTAVVGDSRSCDKDKCCASDDEGSSDVDSPRFQEQHEQSDRVLRPQVQESIGYTPTRNTNSEQTVSSISGESRFSLSAMQATNIYDSKWLRSTVSRQFHHDDSRLKSSLISENWPRGGTERTGKGMVAMCSDKDCICARRLTLLRHKHMSVVSRLRAFAKRYHMQEEQHRKDIELVRRETIAGAEAGLRRLELQNANLRRAVIKSKIDYRRKRNDSQARSIGVHNNVVPPPPPPSRRTGQRMHAMGGVSDHAPAATRSFKFEVAKMSDNQENRDQKRVMRNTTNNLH